MASKARYHLYVDRTEKAQELLLKDIETWKNALDSNDNHEIIYAHVVQFEYFCNDVLDHLSIEHGGRSEDEVDFKS